MLTFCAVIGFFSLSISSANDALLFADLGPNLVSAIRFGMLAAVAITIGLMALIPPQTPHTKWHEAFTTANTLMIALATLLQCHASQQPVSLTQPSVIGAVLMYAAIAARQRLRWTLFTNICVLLAYQILIEGRTPEEQAIVAAVSRFLILTALFTIVASYGFEWRDRRVWVLRKIDEHNLKALTQTRQMLNELAIRDALTGLYNRRKLEEELRAAWTASRDSGREVTLLVADIDFFKRYNDTYGHLAGDSCIAKVGEAIGRFADEIGGLAARVGGEEFAILVHGQNGAKLSDQGERLCAMIRELRIEHRQSSVLAHVTISVGTSTLAAAPGTAESHLYACADSALYAAKESGRNCARSDKATDGTSRDRATDYPVAELPLANDDSTTADALETESERAISADPRWLRFPAPLEVMYRQQQVKSRQTILLAATVVGQLVLNAMVHLNQAMATDVAQLLTHFHAWLSALFLAGMAMVCRLTIPHGWREAGFATIISVQAIGTAWILSQSQEQTSLSQVSFLVLFPLFACVVGRLPFRYSCLPAIAAVASLSMITSTDPTGMLILRDSGVIVVNGALFSLIAAYTLEYGARQEWLTADQTRARSIALEAATRRLRALSTTDPLTGLSNRRHFDQRMLSIWEECLERGKPVSLIIIDTDHFKRYNDGYGHVAGDDCLRTLAATIRRPIQQENAFLARLGGEEFAIVLPGLSVEDGIKIAEQVCAAVREAAIPHGFSPTADHVTVSIGVAGDTPTADSVSTVLLARADEALYRVKASGRDGVAAETGRDSDNLAGAARIGPVEGACA